MKSLSSGIWNRVGGDDVSRRSFNMIYMFATFVGIGITALAAWFTLGWTIGWLVAIPLIIAAFAGVFITSGSDNPVISSFGFALTAGAFGMLLGPVVAMYTAASVFVIALGTLSLVAVLGIVGAIIPRSLESWYPWLIGAVWVLIIGMLFTSFGGWIGLPVAGAVTFLNWAGIAIFSALVVFDVNRAMRIPATVDNAIDAALALYLDALNIFIRALALFGHRS